MEVAQLATKWPDAIRRKFFLEDFLLSSPKKKTPLVRAAFTFSEVTFVTPSP
jgi:hypothetical protein